MGNRPADRPSAGRSRTTQRFGVCVIRGSTIGGRLKREVGRTKLYATMADEPSLRETFRNLAETADRSDWPPSTGLRPVKGRLTGVDAAS